MKVARILERKGREPGTVRADPGVATAVRGLVPVGIGALVLSEDGEHVDGLLSGRDIVEHRLGKNGLDAGVLRHVCRAGR